MVDEPNPKIPPKAPSGNVPPLKLPGTSSGIRPPSLPGRGTPPLPLNRPSGSFQGGPGLPGKMSPPTMPPSRDLEERLTKMDAHSRELEESKKKLERSLAEMELKLKDEKEKSLSQAIKAREEESLSLKMEQALKEMQEKTRTARREQELEDARLRSEEKTKDLERRLNEERETWVINMKKQMEIRESETTEIESQLESRLRDLERRWQDEKITLTDAVKSKEQETERLRALLTENQVQMRQIQEASFQTLEKAKLKFESEMEAIQDNAVKEKRHFTDKIDSREKELVSLKAQLAMIDSQVRSAQEISTRNLQEKERIWKHEITDLQRDMDALVQKKDQMQSELTQVKADASSYRKEVLEWEKKESEWEQRVQELKQSLLKLQGDNRDLEQDYDSLQKNYFTERENWANKTEERSLDEKTLRENLLKRDVEITSLTKELSYLETKIRNQYETQKNELIHQHQQQYQELASRKENEIASFKSERTAIEQKLWSQFEKEKAQWSQQHQNTVLIKDKEINALKNEMALIEQSLKTQFEKDKNASNQQYRESLAQRENEISSLRLEMTNLGSRMDQKFDKEKDELLARTEAHFREETALKSELMHRELSLIRDSVMNDLTDLEEQAQKEKENFQSEVTKKDAEIMDAVNAMKELQKELLNERNRREEETASLRVKADHALSDALKQAESDHTKVLAEEKRKFFSEMNSRIEQEKENTRNTLEQLQRDCDEKSKTIHSLNEEHLKVKSSDAGGVSQSSGSATGISRPTLTSRIWKYLNRTVIVLNLKTVPKISKKADGQ